MSAPSSKPVAPVSPVCVIDPVSTGAALARYIADHGVRVVRCFSDVCPPTVRNHVKVGFEVDWLETVQHETGKLEDTVAKLRALGCADVLVGCETGVTLCDEICEAMGARGNTTLQKKARRNKFEQAELVRRAGLDAPRQMLAEVPEDVEAFLATFDDAGIIPFKAVIKPVEGAGSDGVSICNAPDEVRAAYKAFEGTKNVLGLDNYQVLLQEFLHGTEYVVDTVSRDGEHKVVAIWRYDKRDYHGRPVVYHGMRLLNVESNPQLHKRLVEYILAVLNALGIRNGAMHSEVMATPRGPVLVEVNCRLHGGEGIWLPIASRCFGYTAVSAMYDAYFNSEAFAALPPSPPEPMLAHGAWVTVRSPASGVISQINEEALQKIRKLRSYFDEYLAPCLAVGRNVEQTVDACTVHGCFNLAHEDKSVLEADYQAAQLLINQGLFAIEGYVLSHSPSPILSSSPAAELGISLFGSTYGASRTSSGASSPLSEHSGPARRVTHGLFGSCETSPVLKFSTSPKLMGLGVPTAALDDLDSLTLDAPRAVRPASEMKIAVNIS